MIIAHQPVAVDGRRENNCCDKDDDYKYFFHLYTPLKLSLI